MVVGLAGGSTVGMIWLPDRHKHQGRIVAALYERSAAVLCDRQAVFAVGIRGADKQRALARAGISPSRYLTVSVDLTLAEMARRSLIPVTRGLSPLEGADLVHAEAQHIAKRLAARAIADGRNLLLDVTMASQPSVQSWLVNLGLAMYAVEVALAPVSGEDAVRRADAEHRHGQEKYLNGEGPGGRYVPAEAILAAASVAASIAASDWATILQHLTGQQEIAFPRGELLSLARAYRDGRLTLASLSQRVRSRRLPPVPPARPGADGIRAG